MHITSTHRKVRAALATAALFSSLSGLPAAHAGEIYTGLGIPGVGLGYAHPLNESFTLRGDIFTLGSREANETEEGISYRGKFKLQRAALLADWFPFAGSFRLTGGAAFNTYKITLDASGAGGSIEIGDRTYTTGADDGLTVQVQFPKTTPYIGIGWGHQKGSGFRFSADIGASIGRATVTGVARGLLAGQTDIEANINKELVELRKGVGKVRAIPQLSIGIGYSF